MTEDTARKLMGGAALATGVGTFLPWVTIAFVSLNGIQADRGQGALGAAIAGALLLLWRDGSAWLQIAASTISGGLALWFAIDVASMPTGPLGLHAQTAAGCWVTIVASVVWLCLAGRSRELLADSKRSRREQRSIASLNEERLAAAAAAGQDPRPFWER